MTENKFLGRRYDGKKSPLGDQPSWDRLQARVLSGTLSDALLHGSDEDVVRMAGHDDVVLPLRSVREALVTLGVTPEQFSKLAPVLQDRISNDVAREGRRLLRENHPELQAQLQSGMEDFDRRKARTELHRSLVAWSSGPLTLEKPNGSSYHLLEKYDPGFTPAIDDEFGRPQSVVVQNDWARVMAGKDPGGEIRMPFPRACWEFRVSGVRVLAIVSCTQVRDPVLFCVYGRDHVWVADDYVYIISSTGKLMRGPNPERHRDAVEFRRVSDLVYAQIRACCILMEVGAVHREEVTPSAKIVQAQTRRGHPAPRSHLVVRLAPRARAHYPEQRRRTGSPEARAPQRGHLRRGTWVHYQDVDSGDEPWANDGGFWLSRTWRPWHWAGDLNRMIDREYRL